MKQQGTILLVDDDRQVLASMADWLRDQGYPTDTASTLSEATGAVTRKTYDLVLADIRLGNEDGFDLLTYCRKNYPGIAVIMITGYGTVETAVEAVRQGAFDFLTKPFTLNELEAKINRVICSRASAAKRTTSRATPPTRTW